MQLVVVIAVSAADSAAMTTRTMTSHTFFFSFITFNTKFRYSLVAPFFKSLPSPLGEGFGGEAP